MTVKVQNSASCRWLPDPAAVRAWYDHSDGGRRHLWPQLSIAYHEHLTGEAGAMVAEQVRDDICYAVG
jgi:hypothetical protein